MNANKAVTLTYVKQSTPTTVESIVGVVGTYMGSYFYPDPNGEAVLWIEGTITE